MTPQTRLKNTFNPSATDAPNMLPDLSLLAKLGQDVAKFSTYLEQAGQFHVANLQAQINALQDDASLLEQEHQQALDAVNIDYRRKLDRNLAMQNQLASMVEFYTQDGKITLKEPTTDLIPTDSNIRPLPRKRNWLGIART